MKVRSLLVGMLCMLALSVSFASCSDDDDDLLDDSGSTVALPQVRAFFMIIDVYIGKALLLSRANSNGAAQREAFS